MTELKKKWSGLLQNCFQGSWLTSTRSNMGWKSARNLRRRSEMTQTSFQVDASSMYGYNPETKSSHPNWSGWRKHSKWKAMWSQYWYTFLTLLTTNLSLQVILSMWSSAAMSWGKLGRIWGRGGQTHGAWTSGCSIITMHVHTPLWLWRSFWPPKTWWLPPSFTCLFSPCDFFLSPKMKIKLKGWKFDSVGEISQNHRQCCGCWCIRTSGQLPVVAETFESLCTRPRGLLGRERWRLGLTVWLFLNTFWELLHSTSFIVLLC